MNEEISLTEYLKAVGPKNKFFANRREVDGIWFDSAKEAKRYSELKILERAGMIKHLTLQPEFILTVNDIKIGKWIGDFSYLDIRKNEAIVEDVKGVKTPFYKWKKKHFEAQYGRRILET